MRDAALQERLRDLHRVERRALSQVVACDEEAEPVRDGRVATDPADERDIATRRP